MQEKLERRFINTETSKSESEDLSSQILKRLRQEDGNFKAGLGYRKNPRTTETN